MLYRRELLRLTAGGILVAASSARKASGQANQDIAQLVRDAVIERKKYASTVDYLKVKDRFVIPTHGTVASEQWPQPAPALPTNPEVWLNTDGQPLYLKYGVVTLIDFWEYTCVNCLRTLPYLKRWNTKYSKDGLVIIGIHTPEFQFAKDQANIVAAIKKYGIVWPVINDSDYANWKAYRNTFWPRKYFVDAAGTIVTDHPGEGGYEESEGLLQQMIRQADPTARLPLITSETSEIVTATSMTPELYAGMRGAQSQQHGNIGDYTPDKTRTYRAPDTLLDGKIYLQGVWQTEEESLRHGRTSTDLTDKILLRYHARECNAVIKPEGNQPLKVFVTQDGKPVAKSDRGQDLQYAANGESYLQVDQPRMYRLTHNATFSNHTLTLASTSPDFALYSFTFSATTSK